MALLNIDQDKYILESKICQDKKWQDVLKIALYIVANTFWNFERNKFYQDMKLQAVYWIMALYVVDNSICLQILAICSIWRGVGTYNKLLA